MSEFELKRGDEDIKALKHLAALFKDMNANLTNSKATVDANVDIMTEKGLYISLNRNSKFLC